MTMSRVVGAILMGNNILLHDIGGGLLSCFVSIYLYISIFVSFDDSCVTRLESLGRYEVQPAWVVATMFSGVENEALQRILIVTRPLGGVVWCEE